MKHIKLGFLNLNPRTQEIFLGPMLQNQFVDIVGACDPFEWNYQIGKAKDNIQIDKFEHYPELLEKVDAMVITSPQGFHVKQIRQAAEAGVHVLFEQPLSLTKPELVELEQLTNGATVLTACFPRQFDPLFTSMAKLMPVLRKDYGTLKKVSVFSHLGPAQNQYEKKGFFELAFAQDYEAMSRILAVDDISLHVKCRTDKSYQVVGSCTSGNSEIGLRLEAYRVKENKPQDVRIRFEFENGESVRYTDFGFECLNKAVKNAQMCNNFVDAVLGKAAVKQSGAVLMDVLSLTTKLQQDVCG